MPWLAGPLFTALAPLKVAPPSGSDVTAVERFLIGAQTQPGHVDDAIVALELEGIRPEPALPPDARGVLLDAVDRYYALLGDAYGEVSDEVQAGHRRTVETLLQQWQVRLDEAAGEIEERVLVLVGTPRPAPAAPRRRVRDHPGLALAFVVVALGMATAVMWLVLQGWPMQPVDIGL